MTSKRKLLSVYSWKDVHKHRARNARLGPLATEELAELLERTFQLGCTWKAPLKDKMEGLALAARIREALALEGNDEKAR